MMLSVLFNANAQHFMVKGGVNYSTGVGVKDVKEQYKGIAGWELGVGYQTSPIVGFTFQPELYYKMKGVQTPDYGKVKFNYVQLPFNVQWGPNLVVFRPYVFLGPYIAYNFKATSSENVNIQDLTNDFCAGLGGGVGVDFWRMQVVFKYDYNFGSLLDWESYPSQLIDLTKVENLGKGCMEFTVAFKL